MRFLLGSLNVLVICSPILAAPADDVDELIKQLQSSDSDARRAAVKRLAARGKEARAAGPALVTALKSDKDLYVRRFAAQALGDVGADPALAAPALSHAVRTGRKEIAEAALTSLGKLGPDGVPALIEVVKKRESRPGKPKGKPKDQMDDSAAALRAKAIQALGNLGPQARAAVPVLIDALREQDVRTDAASALGNIGPDARDAVTALTEAAADKGNKKDKNFQTAVKDALAKIRTGS